MPKLFRPQPTDEALAIIPDVFIPAPELAEWARAAFIVKGQNTHNPDHAHLAWATFGFLWTNVPNSRQALPVVGTAEPGHPKPSQVKWVKARQEYQVCQWFGDVPDFIITIYAPYAVQADDFSFCALIEHELYHCGQAKKNGVPSFKKDGTPKFCIVGHDVEEFVGVVARYGAAAAAGKTLDLVEAASKRPIIGRAKVTGICGTCERMAA